MRVRLIRILLISSLAVAAILLPTMLLQRDGASWQVETGKVFGTSYNIKYRYTLSLKHLVRLELEKVDKTFSIFNPKSLVSRLNASRTDSINSLFREVFTLSGKVFDDTGGAFDPTVRPAVEAWGFGRAATPALPPASTDSLLRLIGFQKLSIQGNVLKRPSGTTLDFGAIAKGYAVDRVARILESAGVDDYMIEIGGEIRVLGHNPDGEPWTVGIVSPPTSPTDTPSELLPRTLKMTSGAVATSGNYNNVRTINGKRHSHTINPHTAAPQLSDILSATVIATSCAEADAYATAFMVMGKNSSDSLLARKKTSTLRAILITDQ